MARTEVVKTRLSQEEKAWLQELADDEARTPSALLRYWIRTAKSAKLKQQKAPVQ